MAAEPDSAVASLVAWSEDVRSAVRRLDPVQGRIIGMIYFERRTQQQVADELDLSRRDVARSFARGLQALAVLIVASASD